MKITLLVDNNSWIIPYAEKLKNILVKKHNCELVYKHSDVKKGDLLVLMGCVKLFKSLHLNKHNIVVHESNLPLGKGWSPLTWQILEGINKIPITLFEAVADMDAGNVYIRDFIELNGDELFKEIKHKQGEKTNELILKFIEKYIKNKNIVGQEQKGKETFYSRRTPIDSELDVNKSIKEQFNLLRVCDNKNYPAFFNFKGKKYIVNIESI